MSLVVDVHHHYIPEEVVTGAYGETRDAFWRGVPLNSVQGRTGLFGQRIFYDIGAHLREMDAARIDLALLSSNAGLHATMTAARFVNDRTAEIVRAHPDRFRGLASVPALAPTVRDELTRAITILRLVGVFLPCQVDGRTLDDAALAPFWSTVAELDVPIFIHPSHIPPRFELIDDHYETPPFYHRMFGREFDVVTEMVRLICGGVLDRFPTLRIVMPHCGGGIAALIERITAVERLLRQEDDYQLARGTLRDYLSAFHVDTAGSFGGLGMIRCALTSFAPEQLLFGTDYPIAFRRDADEVRRFQDGISATVGSAATGVLGENALRLLGA